MIRTTATLYAKNISIELSDSAVVGLAKRSQPLYAEVQLIFGCMIAKRVWFSDEAVEAAVPVIENLYIWFRPARYEKACSFAAIDSGAIASDYPMVVDRKRFVPDRVSIDFQGGQWLGNFTYSTDLNRSQNPIASSIR